MTMNWRNPGMEYPTGNSIYDYNFQNPTGLNANNTWSSAELMHIEGPGQWRQLANGQWVQNPGGYQYQRPDTSQQPHSGSVAGYLQNEGVARGVFGLGTSQGNGAGGMPWGEGAQGGLQAQGAETLPVSSQLSGANLTYTGAHAASAAAPTVTGASTMGAWYTNPQLWGAVLGAGSSYLEQQQANSQARQANQPRPYSNQTTPWGPAGSNLEFGLAEALRRYQNQPRVGGGGGGGRGGGGGGNGGSGSGGGYSAQLSPEMQGLLSSMVSRGTNVPSYIQAAQGEIPGMVSGGGSNPYLTGAYNAAEGYNNPYYDQFIQSLMGSEMPRGGGGLGGGRSHASIIGSRPGGGGGGYQPNQWLRASLEGEWLNEGNEEMDALLETMANETREQYLRELAPSVDAEYIRAGRYGSDAYSRAQAYAAEEFGEALAGQQAQTRYANYNDERQRMQDSLGLMTSGEIAAMQAAAQRDSAASSAGASRYATDAQLQLGNRGLLLDAIRGVSADDMNRMGLMGEMAGLFGEERLGALNAIPGLEEASWVGPGMAWGAGFQNQSRLDDIQAQREARAAAARAQQQNNALRRWQMGAEMDNQRFNDLMRWSLAAGETFGQTSGVNTPGQFIPQGSTAAAALQGGLGGYMFGSGLQQR